MSITCFLSSILHTLMCVQYLYFPMCILLFLAQGAFQFDHYQPLRLQECCEFLQSKKPCNTCLSLVNFNHLEVFFIVIPTLKVKVHVLLQELMYPFPYDFETSKCITYDFKSKIFYHAPHNGLYCRGNKWLTSLYHFLEHGNQGISKFQVLFKDQHVVFSLFCYNPNLLCMKEILFQITLGCKLVPYTCPPQFFIWTWDSMLLVSCFEEV